MISLIPAIMVFAITLVKRTIEHAGKIKAIRRSYANEGLVFPFSTMGSVQHEMLFHRTRFLETEVNVRLRNARIDLLKDYKSANVSPIRFGLIAFGISFPIEIVIWILIYK